MDEKCVYCGDCISVVGFLGEHCKVAADKIGLKMPPVRFWLCRDCDFNMSRSFIDTGFTYDSTDWFEFVMSMTVGARGR